MTTKSDAGAFADGVRIVRIQRLSDPGPAGQIEKLTEKAKQDPTFAKQWLREHGFITPTGKTTRRFGGR